jgi:hypothetical protein
LQSAADRPERLHPFLAVVVTIIHQIEGGAEVHPRGFRERQSVLPAIDRVLPRVELDAHD